VNDRSDTAVCPEYRFVKFSTSIIKPSLMEPKQT
jgi:hypothetical protein